MAKSRTLKGGEKPPKKKEDEEKLPGGQMHFKEAEPMPKNDKIHNLARRAKAASLKSTRAAADYKELKDKVVEAMNEAELEHYHYGDVTVHVDTKSKLTLTVENVKEAES